MAVFSSRFQPGGQDCPRGVPTTSLSGHKMANRIEKWKNTFLINKIGIFFRLSSNPCIISSEIPKKKSGNRYPTGQIKKSELNHVYLSQISAFVIKRMK